MKKIMKNIVKSVIVIAFISCILLVVCQVFYDSDTSTTASLGDVTTTGRVGVKLWYEKSKVDVSLISPSGKVYTRHSNEADYSCENNIIRLTVPSSELGEWRIKYVGKSKKKQSLTYQLINDKSDDLLICDVNSYIQDGKLYLKFVGKKDAVQTKDTVTVKSIDRRSRNSVKADEPEESKDDEEKEIKDSYTYDITAYCTENHNAINVDGEAKYNDIVSLVLDLKEGTVWNASIHVYDVTEDDNSYANAYMITNITHKTTVKDEKKENDSVDMDKLSDIDETLQF